MSRGIREQKNGIPSHNPSEQTQNFKFRNGQKLDTGTLHVDLATNVNGVGNYHDSYNTLSMLLMMIVNTQKAKDARGHWPTI